jgi:endonuclease VIII
VFRAEVLHRCGLHPERTASSLSQPDLHCLWATLSRLMERATVEGRIITVDLPDGVERSVLTPEEGRYVYKQEHCRQCGADVTTWALGNRTAYACPVCQPIL